MTLCVSGIPSGMGHGACSSPEAHIDVRDICALFMFANPQFTHVMSPESFSCFYITSVFSDMSCLFYMEKI